MNFAFMFFICEKLSSYDISTYAGSDLF